MDSVSPVSLVRPRARPLTSGLSANAAEESFVRKSPLYEVVGQLGMWGTLINGVQAASLEHQAMRNATWDGQIGEFVPLPRNPIDLPRVRSRIVASLYHRNVHHVHDGSNHLSIGKLRVL